MSKLDPLRSFHIAYGTRGKAAALSPPSSQQLRLHQVKVTNRSGGANDSGIVVKLANGSWKMGQWDQSATPSRYIDATSTIQAGSAVTIFTLTNNDGFVAVADRQFNMIGMTVSQAQTGSPVFEYNYWNGSAWATLTTLSVPSSYSAADQWIVFLAPTDWATGGDTGDGIPSGYYAVRIRATTASSQAVIANNMWIGQFLEFQPALAQNGTLSVAYDEYLAYVLEGTESVMPYFATANAGNFISGYYNIFS